jgi:hypothetical protein
MAGFGHHFTSDYKNIKILFKSISRILEMSSGEKPFFNILITEFNSTSPFAKPIL